MGTEPSTASDAAALWEDTIGLMSAEGSAQPLVEMMRSCAALSLDDGTLTVATPARFVQRTLSNEASSIEPALRQAAFAPVSLVVELSQAETAPAAALAGEATIGRAEFERLSARDEARPGGGNERPDPVREDAGGGMRGGEGPRAASSLVSQVTEVDSRLTFERFIEGNENAIALSAAKQVANGINKSYNPLFIFGKSGLGKTHLLKAIQNYDIQNDPTRICVYRTSHDFTNDYTQAMVNTEKSVKDEFERNYRDVDVLIIDDIQNLKPTGNTTEFFFYLFNYLSSHGKQIVLAADRSPSDLGMGSQGFDERITSRLDSGFSCSIGTPEYELKLALVRAFCARLREDAEREHMPALDGTLSEEDLELMAERAGSNIRVIEAFCQSCLIRATQIERSEGRPITSDEIVAEAAKRWKPGHQVVTVEAIQGAVAAEYGVSRADIVGNKRTKEVAPPRHVAIWLTRELTDMTLVEIGNRFGGRKHATVKHSIEWVDERRRKDRTLHDLVERIRNDLQGG